VIILSTLSTSFIGPCTPLLGRFEQFPAFLCEPQQRPASHGPPLPRSKHHRHKYSLSQQQIPIKSFSPRRQ
jgi:hypothetical protein